MAGILVNGITIEYESRGNQSDPVILLIMGLGMQLIHWPDELVDALVSRGFRVIRFDNRDTGLSEKFGHAGRPAIRWAALQTMVGWSPRVPYTLKDMAADAAGLLRALKIDKAHVVGASLGGMIAQTMAIEHPEMVASLTSIMSTTGNRRLPMARPDALRVLFSPLPASANSEQVLERAVRIAKVIGSPAYPPRPERLRERSIAAFRRSFYPEGIARQFAAILADGDRRARLQRVTAPTLVIHGSDDPLVPVEGGRDTAQSIPGARFHEIPGMGHDLPVELLEPIAELIAQHAQAA